MDEIYIELVVGIIFVLVVLLTIYRPKKKLTLDFKGLNLSFSKRKREEKLKEIDKKLEEVLSNNIGKEKIVKLEEATEEAAKKFEIRGDLLSEMQISNSPNEPKNSSPEQKAEELALPNLKSLEDLGEVEKEVYPGQSEKEEKTKLEFEESDNLLEEIAKEVEDKEKEEIDLLRDLKGQKFVLEELESELREVLEKARRLKI